MQRGIGHDHTTNRYRLKPRDRGNGTHAPDLDLDALDNGCRLLGRKLVRNRPARIARDEAKTLLPVEAIHLAERHGLNRFISEQPPYNLLDRRIENDIIPMCQRYGMAIIPWAPLGGGVLAGRYAPDAEVDAGSRLAENRVYQQRISTRAGHFGAEFVTVAEEAGMTPAQLALLWVTEQPGITAPIIGPRTMSHLETSLSILDLTLTDAIRARLDELNPPGSAVANYLNNSGWMKMHVPSE